MPIDKKILIHSLDHELKAIGFVRRSNNWHLDEQDLIKVVNLQRSSYSNLYYINLSIYLKGIDDTTTYPKEQECHIRTRLSNKIVRSDIDYDHLFNLENVDMSEERYSNEIKQCVYKNILPQLSLIRSKEGILELAKTIPAILNLLPLKVKSYFQIS